jgi:hypothetical protein
MRKCIAFCSITNSIYGIHEEGNDESTSSRIYH